MPHLKRALQKFFLALFPLPPTCATFLPSMPAFHYMLPSQPFAPPLPACLPVTFPTLLLHEHPTTMPAAALPHLHIFGLLVREHIFSHYYPFCVPPSFSSLTISIWEQCDR